MYNPAQRRNSALAAILFLFGSATTLIASPPKGLAEGYALLYELMQNESNVSQVTIIRTVSPELKVLLKEISASAGDLVKQLDDLKKEDPALSSDSTGLPWAEVLTRKEISSETAHRILFGKRASFLRDLLLSQAQATLYAKNLLKVLGQQDGQASHQNLLNTSMKTWEQYRKRVSEMISAD